MFEMHLAIMLVIAPLWTRQRIGQSRGEPARPTLSALTGAGAAAQAPAGFATGRRFSRVSPACENQHVDIDPLSRGNANERLGHPQER